MTFVGEGAQVTVRADWLEGEVVVQVQRLDEQPSTVLTLSRLPRQVSASVLESRLRQHVETIVGEASRKF